jgi:hypothetical protein
MAGCGGNADGEATENKRPSRFYPPKRQQCSVAAQLSVLH